MLKLDILNYDILQSWILSPSEIDPWDRATSCLPDSKVHGANMGPTWVLSAPDGPHVGPMNLAIRAVVIACWLVVYIFWSEWKVGGCLNWVVFWLSDNALSTDVTGRNSYCFQAINSLVHRPDSRKTAYHWGCARRLWNSLHIKWSIWLVCWVGNNQDHNLSESRHFSGSKITDTDNAVFVWGSCRLNLNYSTNNTPIYIIYTHKTCAHNKYSLCFALSFCTSQFYLYPLGVLN